MKNLSVQEFFDTATWTLTYVVYDTDTRDAVVIDPVWDYDPASGELSFESVNKVKNFLLQQKLHLHFILETHAHADHLSGSRGLQEHFPEAKIGIGRNIQKVQKTFEKIFNLGPKFAVDGSQFDFLLDENQKVRAGSLEIKTFFTPGHTPACASYLIGDSLFTGDAIFMPDYGTGRCDFPEGSADALFDSIQKIYQLPDDTRIFVGHDYQPHGRNLAFQTTIGEEKKKNIHLNAQTTREEFIAFRKKRDASLSAPRLLLPSIQVNIDGGRLPPTESNGVRYLKMPLRTPGS